MKKRAFFWTKVHIHVKKGPSLFLLMLLSPILVSAKEYPYYTLEKTIELPDGGYTLNTDYIGIKTIKVNEALLGTDNARYSKDTERAVRTFQTENELEATGEVDLQTWLKLGLSEEDWYGLGTYTHPILTTAYSSREDIVNAMLVVAKENADAGTVYRVGCSGPAGTYTDCSGLIFQCLYAAGINPEKNIVDHALAIYEYTSRNLEADSMLGEQISKDEIQAGDLVFFQHNGVVCHVGILAGDGKMYDSWPQKGVTFRNYSQGGNVLCFKRVLPDYDANLGTVPENAITGRDLPPGANSMVLFANEGAVVDGAMYDILVAVSDSETVTDITLNRKLSVPTGGFLIGATGAHAEWLMENASKGFGLWIEDDLVYTDKTEIKLVDDEPMAEEADLHQESEIEELENSGIEDELSAIWRTKIPHINVEGDNIKIIRFSLINN